MPDAWLGRLAPSSLLLPRPKLPFQGEGSGTTELLALTICGKPDVIQFHFMLGKTLLAEIKKPNAPRNGPTPTSSKLDEAAAKRADEVLEMLGTSAAGLTEEEAAARSGKIRTQRSCPREKRRLAAPALHRGAQSAGHSAHGSRDFVFRHGRFRAGTVMMLMVILGLSLRFVQETRADNAAAKLKAMISVTATVVRGWPGAKRFRCSSWSRRHCETLCRRHDSGRCPPHLRQGSCSSFRRR